MSTAHHCILIGNNLQVDEPYQFAVNDAHGNQLDTTITPEEFDVIYNIMNRLKLRKGPIKPIKFETDIRKDNALFRP